MISKANIQRLATRLQTEGNPMPDQTLEKDYILSWVLIGLSRVNADEVLVFKGGTALKKIFIPNYRYSEDLDFTLKNATSLESILHLFEKAFLVVKKESNIDLSLDEREEKDNTYTLYANYSGPLGATLGKRRIKIDITISERILFPIHKMPLLIEHSEYNDLPEDVNIVVYDIREIFIEKLCCICSSYRTEPRDIYDVWALLNKQDILSPDFLIEEFKQKANFKEPGGLSLSDALIKKQARYKKDWERRLANQVSETLDFDKVFRGLKRSLRENGYIK